jgi:hypothetical protein
MLVLKLCNDLEGVDFANTLVIMARQLGFGFSSLVRGLQKICNTFKALYVMRYLFGI